jgi:F-type H+-transporting ATPase subunit delta
VIPGSLARRYARALLGLATSPSQRDKFARDLTSLADLARQRDEAGRPMLSVLSADRFALSDRKKLVGVLAQRVGADPVVVKFLEIVLDRGRMNGLLEIARAYQRMADDVAGRVQAPITSAQPLSPDELSKIKSALEKATGKQVVTSTTVDPEIIGGVVAKVGSYVIDGSVRASLEQLRATLRS